MNHAPEGTLQAHLDGETTGEIATEVQNHLDECPVCRAEFERMRADSDLLSSALRALDEPAAEAVVEHALWQVRAAHRRPAPAPRNRFVMGALARAAVLLLVLAGALAAIPGSPLRELLTDLMKEDAAPAVREPEPQPAAVAPAPEPASPETRRAELPGVALLPAQGRMRIMVWSAKPGATIRVNLIDGTRVSVEAGSDAEDVRFRTAMGRIEVMNLGHAEAVIQIPRSLPFASLDVDGRQWLFKDGDQLRLNGPVIEQAADMVVFRARD